MKNHKFKIRNAIHEKKESKIIVSPIKNVKAVSAKPSCFKIVQSERIKERIEIISSAIFKDIKFSNEISNFIDFTISIINDNENIMDKAKNSIEKNSSLNIVNKSLVFNSDSHNKKINDIATYETNLATIYALTATIDAKDHFTFGHCQRVAKYATTIAKESGFDKNEIEILRQASLVHDIGKIGLPDYILSNPNKLNFEDYEIMKMHVDMSCVILKNITSFNHLIPVVLAHHEHWDGSGYPYGLKGLSIPILARCLSLANAFDIMISRNSNSDQLSLINILIEIENLAGTKFDPILTKKLVKLVKSGELIIEQPRKNIKEQTGLYLKKKNYIRITM